MLGCAIVVMRIVIISSLFFPAVGGAENQARLLARSIHRLGCDVVVLTRRLEGTTSTEKMDGVIIQRGIRTITLGPVWGLSYIASCEYWIRKLVTRNTVIHNQHASFHSWPSLRIANKIGIPLAVRFACAGEGGELSQFSQKWYGDTFINMLKRADRFNALSLQMKQELVDYGFETEKIRFQPNGVDTDQFVFTERRQRINKILFVGRLEKQKAVSDLLNALAITKSDEWMLSVYGDGSEKAMLIKTAEKLGLNDKVKFYGNATEIEQVYKRHDLLILPSYSEGMPNVVLEAMSSGLPVIATRIGGTIELLQGHANDWMFEAGNIRQLAGLIERAIAQPDVMYKCAQYGRKAVEDNFSALAVARNYIDDYQLLLSKKRLSCK